MDLSHTPSSHLSFTSTEIFTHPSVENPDCGNKKLPTSRHNGIPLDVQKITKCEKQEAQTSFVNDYPRNVADILDQANSPMCSRSVSSPTP